MYDDTHTPRVMLETFQISKRL